MLASISCLFNKRNSTIESSAVATEIFLLRLGSDQYFLKCMDIPESVASISNIFIQKTLVQRTKAVRSLRREKSFHQWKTINKPCYFLGSNLHWSSTFQCRNEHPYVECFRYVCTQNCGIRKPVKKSREHVFLIHCIRHRWPCFHQTVTAILPSAYCKTCHFIHLLWNGPIRKYIHVLWIALLVIKRASSQLSNLTVAGQVHCFEVENHWWHSSSTTFTQGQICCWLCGRRYFMSFPPSKHWSEE